MCINQKKCTKLGRDSSFEEACALKIFSGEVLALFLPSSSEESKSFMETQDVSVSEHARIDTIILLLLRNLLAHYLLALWLFKRNIYVKCTNLLLWAPLSETCLILSTKNTPSFHQYKERWKKESEFLWAPKECLVNFGKSYPFNWMHGRGPD